MCWGPFYTGARGSYLPCLMLKGSITPDAACKNAAAMAKTRRAKQPGAPVERLRVQPGIKTSFTK